MIKEVQRKGEKSVVKELEQLHMKNTFAPVNES
jgi:hypothetical protein